jgi:hypothetical protein
MLLFVDHIATKRIIAPALNTVVGGPSNWQQSARRLVDILIAGSRPVK